MGTPQMDGTAEKNGGDAMNLILGNCLEAMRDIPDGRVDLTVTSPPYDNLRSYNGNNAQWGEHVWKATLEDLYRVTKGGGVVVWVVGDATIKGGETGTSFKQALHAMACGFRLHDTMIYHKHGSGPPNSAHRYGQSFEYMFVFSRGTPSGGQVRTFPLTGRTGKITRRQRDGSVKKGTYNEGGGKLPNVWQFAWTDKSDHPATFPLQLATDHIKSWSNEGDTILDPFMGSGTTGVACKNLDRNFIGIEMDAEYFRIASERINAISQTLWADMR